MLPKSAHELHFVILEQVSHRDSSLRSRMTAVGNLAKDPRIQAENDRDLSDNG